MTNRRIHTAEFKRDVVELTRTSPISRGHLGINPSLPPRRGLSATTKTPHLPSEAVKEAHDQCFDDHRTL
jgi:hypothetical protein